MNTREVTHQYRLNQWTEIIRECRSSGQKIATWCADHNINPKSYYYFYFKSSNEMCDFLNYFQLRIPFAPVSEESIASMEDQNIRLLGLSLVANSLNTDNN